MKKSLNFKICGNSMSPKYKDGDSISLQKYTKDYCPDIDDIVVFMHPLKKNCRIIKRITKIKNSSKLFVEGDNSDILSSNDSHNFGYIELNKLIAIKKEKNEINRS